MIPSDLYQKLLCISILGRLIRWTKEEGKVYSCTLLGIVILGSFLRLYRLGHLSLFQDEVYHAMSMRAILENGIPVFPSGIIYTRALTQSYLGAFFSLFTGINELAVRLPSALGSILIILLIYLICRDFGDKKIAIFGALAWALFPWAVEFARWGRMYTLLSFFVLGTFYFSYSGFKKYQDFLNKSTVIALSMVFFSLITHQYGLISVPILIVSFILWGREKRKISNNWKVGIALFTFLSHPLYSAFSAYISGHSGGQILSSAINSYPALISTLLTRFQFEQFFMEAFYSKFFLLVLLAALYLPVTLKFGKARSKEAIYLSFFAFFSWLMVGYYHLHLQYRYLFYLIPLFISAGLLGIRSIKEMFKKIIRWHTSKNKVTVIFLSILLIFVFGSVLSNAVYSFRIPNREYGEKFQDPFYAPTRAELHRSDYKTQMEYVSEQKNRRDIVITTFWQYYYFYAREEPDYWLWPGANTTYWAVRETERGPTAVYMSKTLVVSKKYQLFEVVENAPENIDIWFPLSFSHKEEQQKEFLKELTNKGYEVKKAFTGGGPNAVVYMIEK